MDSESVDLIYLDPPFNSGKQWANPVKAAGRRAMAEFKDTWDLSDIHADHEYALGRYFPEVVAIIDAMAAINGESWKAYLIYMGVRLMEMRRVLRKTGSIYYHCDPVMSHGVKLIMDAIFGKENFLNEIIWHYATGGASKNFYAKKHDIIFFYSRTKQYKFYANEIRFLRTQKSLQRARNPKGARISDTDITKLPIDVWVDINALNPMEKERTGYPTQKPLALLERIVAASSNQGDIVLDPFCGCATTCLAAERLRRNWIGIDLSEETANLVVARLRKEVESPLADPYASVEHMNRPPKRKDLIGHRTEDRMLRPRLHKQQGQICLGCERKIDMIDMELDHIIATSRGGQNIDDNLQLLCGRCNSSKGDRGMDYLRRKILQQRTMDEMKLWREKRNEQLMRRGF